MNNQTKSITVESYDAFLSYHGRDRPLARQLFSTLTSSGLRIWMDCECIAPGDDWLKQIQRALSECRLFVVLLTTSAPQRWVDAEVAFALRRYHSGDDDFRIIPVVSGPAPTSQATFLDAFQRVEISSKGDIIEPDCLSSLVDALKEPIQIAGSVRMTDKPYVGLEPFGAENHAIFFGRENRTDELLTLVASNNRWVQVEGASGIGKSSLVRAGVVPALRRGIHDRIEWHIVEMRPGVAPLKELATALHLLCGSRITDIERELVKNEQSLTNLVREHDREQPTLLIVDQFEELFTATDNPYLDSRATKPFFDQTVQQQFVSLLLAALGDVNGPLRLLTTIRSDFLHYLEADEHLAGAMNEAGRYVVSSMQRNELRKSIEGPLRMGGGRVDSQVLIDRLLDDVEHRSGLLNEVERASGRSGPLDEVEGGSGRLGLLNHVLYTLWERACERGDRTLRLRDYLSCGELGGALTHSADRTLNELDLQDRDLARRIFLELVQIRSDAAIAKITTRAHIVGALGNGAERILTQLSGGRRPDAQPHDPPPLRLVSVDESENVTVIHESLIAQWNTLRVWLTQARRDMERRDDIESAARIWDNADHPKPDPSLLDYYEDWTGDPLPVSQTAGAYLGELHNVRRKRTARSRGAIASLIVAIIVLLSATALSQYQRIVNALDAVQLADSPAHFEIGCRSLRWWPRLGDKLSESFDETLKQLTDQLNERTKLGFELVDAGDKQFERVLRRVNSLTNSVEKSARATSNLLCVRCRLMRSTDDTWEWLRWPNQKLHGDPTLRTYLIHQLSSYNINPKTVIDRLRVEQDTSIRRALVLAIGRYDKGDIAEDDRRWLTGTMKRWLRDDPDSGVHSAVEWALYRWDEETRTELDGFRTGSFEKSRGWYLTKQHGHTMVILEPDTFQMGTLFTRAFGTFGTYHKRHFDYRYSIAAREVTNKQFRVFCEDNGYSMAKTPSVDEPDAPALGVTWYQAAHYCNWLSDQEGLDDSELCYESNRNRKYDVGMGCSLLKASNYAAILVC